MNYFLLFYPSKEKEKRQGSSRRCEERSEAEWRSNLIQLR